MLRRYLPTLILLLSLLAVGGYAVAKYTSGSSPTRGGYVPTISSDPQTAAVEALVFAAILGGVVFTTIGLGLFLAITSHRLTKMILANPQAMVSGEGSAKPGGPKAPAKGGELSIPLNGDRAAAVFWVVVVLLVVGFQALRFWSSHDTLGYLPGVHELLRINLFRLPGTHISGLPPFVAGPGDEVTALHVMIGVLINVLLATAVTGFIMARAFVKLSATVNSADRLKPTAPDRLIALIEARINELRHPRPRRFNPRNPINTALIGLNALLVLVIGGIVALYVVPSYGSVAAVDRSMEATKIALSITATPMGGATQGSGQNEVEVLQAEFVKLPPGNPEAGQGVFTTAGCAACHSLKPDERIVGPSLAGVAARAGTRRTGYPPEIYIYQSITNPDSYVVEGFQPLMPKDFRQRLTPQQLADVIAYLLTLK